ncbi:glycoside hydrolase family 25 protein [Sphaerobolus stellatus SS14]|nr:glycoside hydrolase family 25 protein [Sphaerobolus stellatus SS14]
MFRVLLVLPALITASYALVYAVDSCLESHIHQSSRRRVHQGHSLAKSADYTDIDTYWYPCNGNGNGYKSYAAQLAELDATFNADSMKIGTIWIDFGKEVAICNNWNYGTTGILTQAKAIIAAVKAAGYSCGICSSPGSLTLGTKFGGWVTAVGHQYTDVSASGQFDLSVFKN